MKKEIYRYQPTKNGFLFVSKQKDDPHRRIVSPLYPDNRKELLFSEDQIGIMKKYPFRPVVFSQLSPQYCLDMHCASGLSGYGRFALTVDGESSWLDECDEIEVTYNDGRLLYSIRDRRFSGSTIHLEFVPSGNAVGLIIKVDSRELKQDTKIYFVHGGMLNWNTHTPFLYPFKRDMCQDNVVKIYSDKAVISREKATEKSDFKYEGLSEIPADEGMMNINRAWNILEGWQRRIFLRAESDKNTNCSENREFCVAPPEALNAFEETLLLTPRGKENSDSEKCLLQVCGGVAVKKLDAGNVHYIAVGLGNSLESVSLKELYQSSVERTKRIGQSLVLESSDFLLDCAVHTAAYPTHAIYGDNVFMHGAVSWREGYLGWRSAYGPLAYGMTKEARKHFLTHFESSWITEGPDRESLAPVLEAAQPDTRMNYNMYETFLDQAKKYWEYTGDSEFAKLLLPKLEGCIRREIRRLKPGKEWLFENSLNTWISDSHWTIVGQCTQASAYMYDLFLLAAELSEETAKKEEYCRLAKNVKADLFRVLWQKRKGVFGYQQDMLNNRLFHPEPELADIYHTAEFGLTDKYETYQMLDWVEANLRKEELINGAEIYWSSNWHPNAGGSYTHSTYELAFGEQMNLAMAYQKAGLAEKGYKLFKCAFLTMFGIKDAPIVTADNYRICEVAGDLPSQIRTDGGTRMNPHFGDAVGMFGRALFEGVLGIHPKLQRSEIELMPALPEEINKIRVDSHLIEYAYIRTDEKISIDYKFKNEKSYRLCIILNLPVSEIEYVTVNGIKAEYTTEPHFEGVQIKINVEASVSGKVEVQYKKQVLPRKQEEQERLVLYRGEALSLDYPGEQILGLKDPQGLLCEVKICNEHMEGIVLGAEGSGAFFLCMKCGNAEYIRPIKVRICSANPIKTAVFRNFKEEYQAPYSFNTVNMDRFFNASTPMEVLRNVCDTVVFPPEEYNQINTDYYRAHLVERNLLCPEWRVSNERWRSLVNEDGIALTGEGIPFRSKKEGNCMAVTTLAGTAYPDRITVPVGGTGRAVYFLVTGTTYPMQSHVENLRITLKYEDKITEEHRLINPTDIGDMWFTLWGRYHDTPGAGFENLGGHCEGALSSLGCDLTKPIPTGTEAHIIGFPLRHGAVLQEIEMITIANDAIFALMGITILQ